MREIAHTKSRQRQDERVEALRLETFNAYGGPRCTCCGETEPVFLTLDHSRNDGWKNRQVVGDRRSGIGLYGQLKALGYPQDLGLRVQCFNCNCGRARNGGVCPHARRRMRKGHHTFTILTQEEIDLIKRQHKQHPDHPPKHERLTLAELAHKYSTSVGTIFKIQRGLRTRSHGRGTVV